MVYHALPSRNTTDWVDCPVDVSPGLLLQVRVLEVQLPVTRLATTVGATPETFSKSRVALVMLPGSMESGILNRNCFCEFPRHEKCRGKDV